MRSESGNQCSSPRGGFGCSLLEDLRIKRAETFWTFWSLCKRQSWTPASRQLPWSKWDRMSDTAVWKKDDSSLSQLRSSAAAFSVPPTLALSSPTLSSLPSSPSSNSSSAWWLWFTPLFVPWPPTFCSVGLESLSNPCVCGYVCTLVVCVFERLFSCSKVCVVGVCVQGVCAFEGLCSGSLFVFRESVCLRVCVFKRVFCVWWSVFCVWWYVRLVQDLCAW